ncbi:hypothetical protein [Streptomyces acidicola]|uniref:hypothetical protein n=1 Tax=Streptomyces acidicola TaxID=2596892 RepID=UPI00381C1B9D
MEQREQRTSARIVVVDPDLGAQCDRAEHHLLAPLAGSTRGTRDHALFTDGLAAFRRIRTALAEAVARGPRVWTPNGRWEHEGLRIAEIPPRETDVLYALLRELSAALVSPPDAPDHSGVVAALRDTTPSAGPGTDTAVGLVGTLARVLALVDLAADADTATLFAALEAADGEDVRLTHTQEDAWQRLAHRVTMLLTESEPLHRFLY